MDSRSNLERHLSEDITRFEIDEGVGIVTFNRPKALNAMLIKQAGELAKYQNSMQDKMPREMRGRCPVQIKGTVEAVVADGGMIYVEVKGEWLPVIIKTPDKASNAGGKVKK